MPKGPSGQKRPAPACLLALFVLAGPAFAQAPEPGADQKPYILDAPPLGGLKSFSPPTPVTVIVPGDPVPKVGPTPPRFEPRAPLAPPQKPDPAPPKKGLG